MTAEAPQIWQLIPLYPPAWAEVFGEDDAGIFAECVVLEVRFVWRWIPPGKFTMGSPAGEVGRYSDEGPQHEVTISQGFWFGETPVTQAQWQAVMGNNPSHFKGSDSLPVEQVDWHQCVAFSDKLNEAVPGLFAALPTEAQWEYACRAGTQSAFHDGSACTQPEGVDPALNELGWYDKNSGSETHPVKQKLANAWGLYDLHGNVWEWCRDDMRKYTAAPQRDPVGALESAPRVARGGAWSFQALVCRAAYRGRGEPVVRWLDQGFRLVAGQEPRAAEPQGAERPEAERRPEAEG